MRIRNVPQQEVAVILARQLASYLALPVFLVDPQGNLLFYNEPAEAILGRRFDETGKMPVEEWATVFAPTDGEGAPIPPEELLFEVTLAAEEAVFELVG